MVRPHRSGSSLAPLSFVTSIIAHTELAPQLSVAAENTSFIREHVLDRHSEEGPTLIGLCLVELHARVHAQLHSKAATSNLSGRSTLWIVKRQNLRRVCFAKFLFQSAFIAVAPWLSLSKDIDPYHGLEPGDFGKIDFHPSSLMVYQASN